MSSVAIGIVIAVAAIVGFILLLISLPTSSRGYDAPEIDLPKCDCEEEKVICDCEGPESAEKNPILEAPIPEDFPHREILEDAGITTFGELDEVEDFTTIHKIGPTRATNIIDALIPEEFPNEFVDMGFVPEEAAPDE